MTNILILGAHGQIARVATDLFLERTDARLTLYLRNAKRLKISGHADRVRVVGGDVLDTKALESAMTHIAIAELFDGKAVDWMEKVTDEQYGV